MRSLHFPIGTHAQLGVILNMLSSSLVIEKPVLEILSIINTNLAEDVKTQYLHKSFVWFCVIVDGQRTRQLLYGF